MRDMAKQSYLYSAYGLSINSDIRLSELIPSKSGKDIRIKLKKLDRSFLNEEMKNAETFKRVGCTVKIKADKTLYDWDGIGKALIRYGREVLIEPEIGIEVTDLAPFITGSILGNLLNQRGFFVLHGSGIVVKDQGITFLGDKGAGKSTLAVHLQNRGYQLITDDLIPIYFKDEEIRTTPGFPRIRLWSDSVRSIGLNPEILPQINSFVDKHSYKCFENFSKKPVKLSHIFILTDDEKMEIERLNSQESFIEIVKNTYMNRYLQATGQSAEHFRQSESIVKTVPVFRLKRPHDFSKSSQVAELIEGFV
jgi:hypothetical protein